MAREREREREREEEEEEGSAINCQVVSKLKEVQVQQVNLWQGAQGKRVNKDVTCT